MSHKYPDLSIEQRELAVALDALGMSCTPSLGEIYHGAIVVLGSDHAEKFAQCAHSLRELIDKFSPPKESGPDSRKRAIETKLTDGDPAGWSMPQPLIEKRTQEWSSSYHDLAGIAHHNRSGTEDEIKRLLEKTEELLRDWVLPQTNEDFRRIDELVKKGEDERPEEVFEELLKLARKRAVNYGHFMGTLGSPVWIEYLERHHLFDSPPKAGMWPASKYLSRIAKSIKDTKQLRRILQTVGNLTCNASVCLDVVAAYKGIPSRFMCEVVRLAEKWLIESTGDWFLADQIAEIVVKLAGDGYGRDALKLAELLFDIKWEPRIEEFMNEQIDQGEVVPLHYGSNGGSYFYEKSLASCIAPLVSAARLQAVEWLSDLVSRAVTFKWGREKGHDFSWIQRHAIEVHEGHRSSTVLDSVIDAARDAFILFVREHPEEKEAAWPLFSCRAHPFFRRMELHVLRELKELHAGRIAEQLVSLEAFGDDSSLHEYTLLLKDCFRDLSPEDQERILEWTGGEHLRERYEARKRDDPEHIDVDKALRAQQLHRLEAIKDDLPAPWQEKYRELAEEFRAPDDPTFLRAPKGGFFTPQSPKSTEDLLAMPVAAVAEFLKTWEYSGLSWDFEAPCPEGLARCLSSAITSAPEKFSAEALQFRNLQAVHLSSFLYGLNSAIRDGKNIDWAPVLELCVWVTRQRDDTLEAPADIFRGLAHNRDCRLATARLIEEGLHIRPNAIPFSLRENVWSVLKPLAEDLHPVGKFDKETGNDPRTLSLNSVRGEAMHGVVRYMLWCKENITSLGAPENDLWIGIDSVPEAKAVLERHLDIAVDPSLAVRSVYGQWFPRLDFLDPEWARSKVDLIFPLQETFKEYYLAAWESYLLYCGRVYDRPSGVLVKQYARAVETQETTIAPTENPDLLAQHLAILYLRGTMRDPEWETILDKFWEVAPGEIRGAFLFFIGKVLTDNDTLPPETLERSKAVLDKRLQDLSSVQPAAAVELASIGSWVNTGKLDDLWILDRLAKAIRINHGHIRNRQKAIERLADLATQFPLEVIECLGNLFYKELDWELHIGADQAREAVATILFCGDINAETKARQLINNTLSQGIFVFSDM